MVYYHNGVPIYEDSDFPPAVAAQFQKDVEEAERGYDLEFLERRLDEGKGEVRQLPCPWKNPLKIARRRAKIMQFRIDPEGERRVKQYAAKHGMKISDAIRTLVDKGLAAD